MENSTAIETLKLAGNAISSPPLRRRPLRSRTYCALVQLLSHCHDMRNSLRPQAAPQAQTIGDSAEVEFAQVTEHNELTNKQMDFEKLFVQQEPVVDNNKESADFQGGDFRSKQNDVQDLVQTNVATKVNGHVALANSTIHGDSVVDKRQTFDCVVENFHEQDSVSCDLEVNLEDINVTRESQSNKGVCTGETFEAINSRFGENMAFESSNLGEKCNGKGSSKDGFMSEEVEHQLRLKEIELEKLISASAPMDFSHCVAANEEIEEGEISGEAGIYDDLMDEFFEDSMLSGERTHDAGHVFGVDKEVFTYDDENRGFLRGDMPDHLFVDRVADGNDRMEMDVTQKVKEKQESQSLNITNNNAMEIQKADPTEASLETLSVCGEILKENTVENQAPVTSEKVSDGDKRKKKKGPLTKERRAKKKKKDRIKRAEKNRKLGVKRLKLQPVLKPKTMTYCRHYLKGRCQEGEKCKFSHDTVPLTKSKPCCHFARHSCMKGDDCPFDHQLSNYPCNNYASKGFCSRGSDCLFSHEMPAGESSFPASNMSNAELRSQQQTMPATKGFSMTSNTSKLEVKAAPVLSNSNPDKHLNIHTTSRQNCDAKSSAMYSPGKRVEQYVSNLTKGTTAQAPKGVNFLFHGKLLLGDSSKHKQAGSSPKADVGNNVGCDAMFKGSGSVQKSNEIAKTVPPRRPQGINFLSFGKVSSDDSKGKTLSSLCSTKINEIEMSLSDDLAKGEQACFSWKGCHNVKDDSKTSQSTVDSVQNLTSRTVAAPRVMNFLSNDHGPLVDSSVKNQAGVHPRDSNIALPAVQEKEITPDSQIPIKISSFQFAQPTDRSADGCSNSISSSLEPSLLKTPSSVQKAVQSTLAFAAKFEPEIKLSRFIGSPVHSNINEEAGNS